MEDAKQWSCLRVLDDHVLGENGAFDRDISKLVVGISPQAEKAGINGTALAEAVRRRFHLEPEMCCDRYVLYMTSLMDSEESLFKLSAALTKIDEEIAGALCMGRNEGTEGTSEETEKYSGKQGTLTWTRDVPRRISMAEAVSKKRAEDTPGRRLRLHKPWISHRLSSGSPSGCAWRDDFSGNSRASVEKCRSGFNSGRPGFGWKHRRCEG